jgi:hypothetical protein
MYFAGLTGDSTGRYAGSADHLAKCLALQQPCTHMQVPFPEAQGVSQGVCSVLNGHTMSQACCASSVVSLSGPGEYLVRVARDVALSTASNFALRAHCAAQAPSILAARRAELADVEIRYDWIHRRAYRADIRPTATFTPAL